MTEPIFEEPLRELDLGEAVVLLEKAIADKGEDFVYVPPEGAEEISPNGCLYFHEGQPSCIVGHMLSYLDVDSGEEIEGKGAAKAVTSLGFILDDEVQSLLNRVQDAQDTGAPWGEALRIARFGDPDE